VTSRVLLIDDDPHMLSALCRQLDERFDLATAANGMSAIAAVEDSLRFGAPFAVALCDMHMPGIDGIETLSRIRDRSPQTVGIMLTGDADRQIAIDAINQGAIFRFYAKPCDAARLGDGIAAGIRQHELLLAERRLAENEERWRLALEAAGDGVWDWNPTTDDAVFSQGWIRMLGIPPEAARRGAAWWSRIHPDDAGMVAGQVQRLLGGDDSELHSEHRLRCGDGTYRWFLARGVVLFRDPDGTALRAIGTHTDVSERRLMEETLRRQAKELELLATTDALTGLWNRRCFLEKAEGERERAGRYGRPLSAVMIDIDLFKRVNDTHGHAAGDIVLRRFTEIVGAKLRRTDVFGRLGGEEFAALLPESDAAGASVVAEILRREIAATPVDLGGETTLRITASFGVAAATGQADTVANLLQRADEALYRAKRGGRNQVACHRGGADRAALVINGGGHAPAAD